MIEKMPQAVMLVDRVLRALEDSQTKMDGVAFCPVTFFQHPALEGWLPEAKALIQHIENVKARNRAAYAYIQHIEGKPHD
jgi:hypothetical protein